MSPIWVASAEAPLPTPIGRDTASVPRELVDSPDLHPGVPYSVLGFTDQLVEIEAVATRP
jgi:hypothetical protein